jgi:signal transduction histidine kinase
MDAPLTPKRLWKQPESWLRVTDKDTSAVQTGIAILCDIHGTVLEVLRDDLGLTSGVVSAVPFTLLVDRGSLSKALDFLVAIRSRGRVLDCQLSATYLGGVRPLCLAGFVSRGKLIVAGAETSDGALRIHDELAERYGGVSQAEEETHLAELHQGRDGALLDSMTSLYNELLSMQRELARRTAELERSRARMATLLSISHEILSTLELRPLLDLILREIESVVDYSSASVLTLSEGIVELHAYRGPDLGAELSLVHFAPSDTPWVEDMMATQSGFAIADLRSQPRMLEDLASMAPPPMLSMFECARSWLSVPLVAKSKTLGILTLLHNEPHRFNPDTLELVEAFGDLVAAAIQSARLFEQLRQAAVMSERARLARELHDSVGQALYTIGLYSDATRLALSSGRIDAVGDNVAEIRKLVREAMSEMRVLAFELRPSLLEEEGLVGALKARLEAVENRSGLETILEVKGEGRLPGSAEAEVYRFAQEALNNIIKHARATRVAIGVTFTDERFLLTIEDDGVGFDLLEAERSGGLGLLTMRERMQGIGGTLEVDSTPDKGTTVRAEVYR